MTAQAITSSANLAINVNDGALSSSQVNLASPNSSATPYTAAPAVGSSTANKAADLLSQIDNAKLSWFHIKMIIVAGMGFFCDSYDLFSISLVQKTIGRIYYPDETYRCQSQASFEAGTAGKNCGKLLAYLGVISDATSKTLLEPWDQARYDKHIPAAIPNNTANAITAIALCGTLAGQLLFGYLGDRLGRRRVFAWSLYIMIIFCAAQAVSFGSSATATVSSLLFFRFWLGVGIGGDYPLSATLMSEYSSKSNRGAFIASVFAMQGIGYLVAATFAIIMASIWRASDANPDHLWRIVLAFGAVPTALTMYARLNMPETPRFTAFVEQNGSALVDDMNYVLTQQSTFSQAANADENLPASLRGGDAPVAQRQQLRVQEGVTSYREFFSKYGMRLFGTASTWFLLDIAFYSQNLSQPDVFSQAGWLPDAYKMTISEEAYYIARAQAILALSSTVPGYWFTVFTIEKMGRWKIQMMGFFFMTVFMGTLAIAYNSLVPGNVGGFVTLYALTFFFANWGPNSTTFVVPAEVFPTRYRTLGHGISAACGKAGAIVGAFGFSYMKTDVSLRAALGLLTGINFLGMMCTFFVPETAGLSLEELGGEEIKTNAQGNGMETSTELVTVAAKEIPA